MRQALWGNPTLFHGVKCIEKNIEKSFLIDPLTTDNAVYHELLTLVENILSRQIKCFLDNLEK